MTFDLNCDMGESFGAWKLGADEEVMPLVTSANIACGFHAGDPTVIRRTVELALRHGVAIGAHPSYSDLQGFGRRSVKLTYREIEDTVLYQVAALHGTVHACGGTLHHVKMHGALYNDAARDHGIALAAVRAIRRLDSRLYLYALAGSVMVRAGREVGLRVVEEGFADRLYEADGTLASRSKPGALFTDPGEAVNQVVQLVRSRGVRTVCIHGDNPAAVAIARAIKAREDCELAAPEW